MLRPLAGFAAVALLALPVVAQVRHHRARPSAAAQAARNATIAADAAANAAAEVAEDDNMATAATAYDANADMSMDTNMTMDNDMSMDTNMTMDPMPAHPRRRARPRHH